MKLGQHISEETRTKMSTAQKNRSPETQAKISAAEKGKYVSAESRAKMSMSHMGKPVHSQSLETRTKISEAKKGHIVSAETRRKISERSKNLSPETRAKMSIAKKGQVATAETRAKMSVSQKGPLTKRWRGGPSVWIRKAGAKRRLLGYVYLNAPFVGCEGHHVDGEQVIHMPKALHHSVYHNQHTGQGMAKINAIAYNFLLKQEVETAMTTTPKERECQISTATQKSIILVTKPSTDYST